MTSVTADIFDIPCCQCDEPGAEDARYEIVMILRAIRRGEPLPPRPISRAICRSIAAAASRAS
jgi:hypothetical protein